MSGRHRGARTGMPHPMTPPGAVAPSQANRLSHRYSWSARAFRVSMRPPSQVAFGYQHPHMAPVFSPLNQHLIPNGHDVERPSLLMRPVHLTRQVTDDDFPFATCSMALDIVRVVCTSSKPGGVLLVERWAFRVGGRQIGSRCSGRWGWSNSHYIEEICAAACIDRTVEIAAGPASRRSLLLMIAFRREVSTVIMSRQ